MLALRSYDARRADPLAHTAVTAVTSVTTATKVITVTAVTTLTTVTDDVAPVSGRDGFHDRRGRTEAKGWRGGAVPLGRCCRALSEGGPRAYQADALVDHILVPSFEPQVLAT